MKPLLRAVDNTGDLVVATGAHEVAEHTFSNTTVFKRTAKGIEESRNRQCELPQRLKSMLLLIDGRTPVSRFLQTLTVYGDVTELFQVLLDLALIEATTVGSSFENTAAKSEATRPQPSELLAKPQAKPENINFDSLSDQMGFGKQAPTPSYQTPAFRPASAPAPFSPEPRAGNFGSAFASPVRNQVASAASLSPQSAQLKRALNLVNDWIPDLFGADSIEVMLELEKCTSNDQLVSTVTELQPLMLEKLGKQEAVKRLGALKEMLQSPF
jgi:hypothetical protein